MRATEGLLALALLLAPDVRAAPVDDAYRGADTNLLAQVRTGFETAPESVRTTRELIALLDSRLPEKPADWPPVFRAYRAALEGLRGKHSHAPWNKYTHSKAGLAAFQGLVEIYPDSIEIRMLRYSFCSQLPEFFELGPQAAQDLAVLVGLFEQDRDAMVPAADRRGMIRWILQNGQPTDEQRRRLERLMFPD